MIFLNSREMYWGALRANYYCSLSEFKAIERGDPSRFVYSIEGTWSSTNYITVKFYNGFIYMGGENHYIFWGWLHPPIKIPLDKVSYFGEKLYWFAKRDVVELTLDNISLKYALSKEFGIKEILRK